MCNILRLRILLLIPTLFAFATPASGDHLGYWTLYQTPAFLWGSPTASATGIRVRVAFGPLASFTDGLDLFEASNFQQTDDGLVLTADSLSDPDFDQIAAQLTNGALLDKVFVETRLLGSSGAAGAGHNEFYWAGRPGSTAAADFSGYVIDRIEMTCELVSWTSPGRDSNNNGIWTDYEIDTRLDFYGTPVPEPAHASALISLTVAAALRRKLRRTA
jgi:hypothetical protein